VELIVEALKTLDATKIDVFVGSNGFRIDVCCTHIGPQKVVKLLKSGKELLNNSTVLVIERMSAGLPSYFDAMDMYDILKNSIPCQAGFGESIYGYTYG